MGAWRAAAASLLRAPRLVRRLNCAPGPPPADAPEALLRSPASAPGAPHRCSVCPATASSGARPHPPHPARTRTPPSGRSCCAARPRPTADTSRWAPTSRACPAAASYATGTRWPRCARHLTTCLLAGQPGRPRHCCARGCCDLRRRWARRAQQPARGHGAASHTTGFSLQHSLVTASRPPGNRPV